MPGLGAYLAAGAASGLGEGLTKQAESERREALARAQARRQEIAAERDRRFRAAQSAQDREFRSSEAEAGREHQSELLDRRLGAQAAARGPSSPYVDRITAADGRIYGLRSDGKAEPITDAEGNPLMASPGSSVSSNAATERRMASEVLEIARELSAENELTGEPGMRWQDAMAEARRRVEQAYGRRLPGSYAPAPEGAARTDAPARPPAAGMEPPAAAVEALLSNPTPALQRQFAEKYGQAALDRALGR